MIKKFLEFIVPNLIPAAFIVLLIFGVFFSRSDSGYGPDYSECEEECGDSRSCFDDCAFNLGLTHNGPPSDMFFLEAP